MKLQESKIGIVGLGNMGGGIAANLVKAGYDLRGYDLKPEAVERLVKAGGKPAQSTEEIVATCDVILTSVEGKASIALADDIYLPNACPGQIYIDLSTVPAPETRRIGQAILDRGAAYLDAPVSGGKGGAAAGTLRVFVGGDRATFDLCRPLFEAIGNPEKLIYGGAIGMGQVVKVVQQLTHRFPDVARMEVMSFGLRAGLDLEQVVRALDVEPDDPSNPYAKLYRAIRDGKTDNLSALFSEWAYFLQEAEACGFRMPMLEAMYEFCRDGPLTGRDPLNRPQPSIWNELMKG
jgi:3-hydroxyisobutyrate dehydrogenase-like beta-hydroxyacid dehydrogenase